MQEEITEEAAAKPAPASIEPKLIRLFELDASIELAKIEVKPLKDEYDRLYEEVAEYLQESGIKTIKNSKGQSVTLLEPLIRARFDKALEADAHKWLKESGYEYAVKETVHLGTLSSIIKDRIKSGEEVPEIIKYHMEKSLRIKA